MPRLLWLPLLIAAVAGCATAPPRNPDDVCEIFTEKRGWYDATKDTYERWGVPIHVQMAIMHQESRFLADARPPRTKLLWIIPWTRRSSAYGYAQVKNETWAWYEEKTQQAGADRDEFDDASDFIGWYGSMTYQLLGISKWDARNQYLAYHEGHGGYRRGTYKRKPWLLRVAGKVDDQAMRYAAQLNRCREDLESRWSLWPF